MFYCTTIPKLKTPKLNMYTGNVQFTNIFSVKIIGKLKSFEILKLHVCTCQNNPLYGTCIMLPEKDRMPYYNLNEVTL